MIIWSLDDSIFQDALVPCRWMRDVTASLAQLTVTNDVTEREIQHDVNENRQAVLKLSTSAQTDSTKPSSSKDTQTVQYHVPVQLPNRNLATNGHAR